jgi:hypothetical protein
MKSEKHRLSEEEHHGGVNMKRGEGETAKK